MKEIQTMPNEVVPRGDGRFTPGHGRLGGKKKGITTRVRDLVEQLGPSADPIRFMLLLIRDRTYQQVTIDATGKKKKTVVSAPLDLILDACKTTAQYLVPKLSAVAHTGADGEGPVETVALNLTAILADPALCEAAQKLALAMADEQAQPQTTPVYGLLGSGDGK
jgi:hypothetical protein